MRSRLDAQLSMLNAELIDMGTLIEYAIENGSAALYRQDAQLARKVIEFDREIDQKERDIEAICLKVLLQQQPVAKDLRFISAALKMITDMERIGDHAADISEIVTMISGEEKLDRLDQIPAMAKETIKMVRDAIDAFVHRDEAAARRVILHDDVVDDLFDRVREDLTHRIVEDPSKAGAQAALDLLMIAKYFERIGDHAVNIAEWVVFAISGIHKEDL